MDLIALLIGLAAGGALGAGLALLAARGRHAAADERLRSLEQRTGELGDELAAAEAAGRELAARAEAEAQGRAVAEERASRVPQLEQRLSERETVLEQVRQDLAGRDNELSRLSTRLEEERRAAARELAALGEAKEQLTHTFEALSGEALRRSQESFLRLAQESLQRFHGEARSDLDQRRQAVEQLVAPLKESLGKVDRQMEEMEKARREAYGGISQQVTSLLDAQRQLQNETSRLSQALRAPNVRGRWGEIQLRRVVEIAGMLPYCDFTEQATLEGEEGRLRPDLVVRLPGDKTVVIDAKAPLRAYLEALELDDGAQRRPLFAEHARHIRAHMGRLSDKGYWDRLEGTPEFVVMFLPGESFFSAALESDPSLIEAGVDRRVILATPTTLIALLRAVSYGWRQQVMAESAKQVSDLGRELHDRLAVFAEHLDKVGRSLRGAVGSYNKAVGTLESRVLVSARRFTELGIASPRTVPGLPAIDQNPRELRAGDGEPLDDLGDDDVGDDDEAAPRLTEEVET